MAVAIKERRPIRGSEAILERPDGSRTAFLPFPTPLYNAAGEFVGAVNMLVDISERKAATDRERLLIRELQHRSSNLLTVVQSIAQRSMSTAGSLNQAKTILEARLRALARAHRRLVASDWDGVSISDIIRDESEPFGARIKADGPQVTLGAQQAQTFALAIHELATNAVKYGALSNVNGDVAVSWRIAANGAGKVVEFYWKERGGPAAVAPSRHGFGTVLIKSAFDDAQFDYGPEGFSCRIALAVIERPSFGPHASA